MINSVFKSISVFVAVVLLGWGISSLAGDDIKSATNNFSAIGFVSEISENTLKIQEAKGSDKSGKTNYNLNIENLQTIETNKKIPLNLVDIKEGDQIIVQGLTNGSTFFVKRIISFTSTPTPVLNTKDEVDESEPSETSTSSVSTSTTISENTTSNSDEIAATSTTPAVDESEPFETTSTSTVSTSTIISTIIEEIVSTSTLETETSVIDTIIETIVDVVEDVLNTENIVSE